MPSIFTAVHEDVELQHDEDVKLMMVDNMYFFQVKMQYMKVKNYSRYHLARVGVEVAIHCDCSLLEQLLYQLLYLTVRDHRSIHAVGLSFLQFD